VERDCGSWTHYDYDYDYDCDYDCDCDCVSSWSGYAPKLASGNERVRRSAAHARCSAMLSRGAHDDANDRVPHHGCFPTRTPTRLRRENGNDRQMPADVSPHAASHAWPLLRRCQAPSQTMSPSPSPSPSVSPSQTMCPTPSPSRGRGGLGETSRPSLKETERRRRQRVILCSHSSSRRVGECQALRPDGGSAPP